MSEPLSSTEIEDVLSSIRRLVSEDMRPAARGPAAVPPVAGDKLILTPALRVVEEPAAAPPTPMFVAVPRSYLTGAEEEPRLDQVVASLGAAVDAQRDDWENETGDDAPEAEDWSVAQGTVHRLHLTDHFEMSKAAAVAAPRAEAVAVAEPEPVPEPQTTAAWAQQDDADVFEDFSEDKPEPRRATLEPDPVWADAAEASVIEALQERPHVRREDDLDDGMRFDEEVMRELVRDILREELAGRLGERITRNIRKLVRAEIARVLSTQDLQ